jgi:hypothetical protein
MSEGRSYAGRQKCLRILLWRRSPTAAVDRRSTLQFLARYSGRTDGPAIH